MNNFKYTFTSAILYCLTVFLIGCGPDGCNQKKEGTTTTQNNKSLTKDTLSGRFDENTIANQRYLDSTDIYGTGNFDYRDSLESYHLGYSIPRDSVYKVWNTAAYKKLELQIKKNPLKPGPYLDRGNHLQNIKFYREAIADYNKYIEKVKTNHSGYMNRGNAYERLKIYDSAFADYNMVLHLKPDDTIANFNKGCIYDIVNKHDSAVYQYDTVIIKDRTLAKAYYNRGASLIYLGKNDEAISNWERAIQLNPRYESELRPRINKLRTTGRLY